MEFSKQLLKEVFASYLEAAFSQMLPSIIQDAIKNNNLRSRAFGLPVIVVCDPHFNISCIACIKEPVLMTEQNVNAVRKWHHKIDPVVEFFLKQISCVDRFRTISDIKQTSQHNQNN